MRYVRAICKGSIGQSGTAGVNRADRKGSVDDAAAARPDSPAKPGASARARAAARHAPDGDTGARERLMAAAAEAFMERGYSGTSIDDVADVLGATKGAVYHYFTSKAGLYFSVQEAGMRRMEERVRPLSEADRPADEVLEAMARGHLLAMFADFPAAKVGVQGLEQSLFKAAGVEERRRLRRVIAMRDSYERMFRDVIERGIAQGVFAQEPPTVLTRGVLGALNWTTLWFDPSRSTSAAALEAMAASLARYAVRGALRRPDGN